LIDGKMHVISSNEAKNFCPRWGKSGCFHPAEIVTTEEQNG
jgi:hypothetical protein